MNSKIKFNTIIYNKKVQKKLGLNLIDFIRFSGKYIEEKNDKIEVYSYFNKKILFEGQYSNRKKNGEGKEYNENGKLIFHGEYLDGKKWTGLEKVYDEIDDEIILFEYEYRDGKIINGKEYDKINGELLYSGGYLNGKRNGYGEEYKLVCQKKRHSFYSTLKRDNAKLITIFSGIYLNGERKKGIEYNLDEKIVYNGEYLHGKKNGQGKEANK